MQFALASETGAQPRNEDAAEAFADAGLFAVCDGLGPAGRGGGERASRVALECLRAWAGQVREPVEAARAQGTKSARQAVESLTQSAFQQASRAIFQAASAEPALHGMCTTMDLVLLLGTHALVAHVGSGRVYLLRHGELHQLTEDHTQLAQLRRLGRLAEVPAGQEGAYAKRLTRAVGFREEVRVDLLEVEIEPGDRFLLCTDGVWLAAGESDIERQAALGGSAEDFLRNLHGCVARAKPRDNYTSLVLDPPAPREGGAEQKIKMLGNVPAFRYLGYQELIRVLNTGELIKLGAGQVVWKEGSPGDEMMLILAGSLDVLKSSQRIGTLRKGELVGEMSVIDSAPRSATVMTTQPTNLLAFPRDSLFALFREESELAVKFLWGMSMEMNKRLRAASNQLVGRPEQESAAPAPLASLPFHQGAR